jgi:hypothetical protein
MNESFGKRRRRRGNPEIMKNIKTKFLLLVMLSMAAPLLFIGCIGTFKELKPLGGGPPPQQRPSVLAVAEIKITDVRISEPEEKMLIHAFQLGVEKWCAEHKAFEFRKDVSITNGPSTAIVLTGAITEIEKGSASARFWVGMGAGQQRVQGNFAVNAADGTKLTAFSARKSYLGGQGIGGWDMMKLEDLMDQLGQLVAETTDKWLRGEKIQ